MGKEKCMKVVSLIVFAFVLHLAATAGNYYLSATGNDTHSGHLPAKAWKTFNRLSKVKFQPGDTLFFHRGDVFECTHQHAAIRNRH